VVGLVGVRVRFLPPDVKSVDIGLLREKELRDLFLSSHHAQMQS